MLTKIAFSRLPYLLSPMTESKTSGTSLETDCRSKYEAHPELWDDVWEKVRSNIRKDLYPEGCWTVKGDKSLKTNDDQKIQIETNTDGYVKINITADRLDDSGNIVYREYTHNQTGKKGRRKDTMKLGMYLHHLAYLKRTYRTSEFLKRSSLHAQSRHTLSHRCNRRECFNPDHIQFEPHVYNLSRGACNAELCFTVGHQPPCLTHTSSVIAAVAKLNQKFGYVPSAMNETAEASTSRSRSSSTSTSTLSSTSSASEVIELDDNDEL